MEREETGMNPVATESEKSYISDSWSGAENIQDETRTYCYPRKKKVLKNGWSHVKRTSWPAWRSFH